MIHDIHVFLMVFTGMHISDYSSTVLISSYFLFAYTVSIFSPSLFPTHTLSHRKPVYLITFILFIHHPSLPPLSPSMCTIINGIAAVCHLPPPHLKIVGIISAFHILQWPKPLLLHSLSHDHQNGNSKDFNWFEKCSCADVFPVLLLD